MDNASTEKERIYRSNLERTIAKITVDSRKDRVKESFGEVLANSPFIPILFETEKPDALDRGGVKSKATGVEPIIINLLGGEKMEIGRYSKPGFMSSKLEYGVAWRILGHNPRGLLVQHPWIIFEGSLDTRLVPLEKTGLGYGEEGEILRWMALFNPADIETEGVEFNKMNFSKILALKSLGVPLDRIGPPDVDVSNFTENIQTLEKLRSKADKTLEDNGRYQSMLTEVARKRIVVMETCQAFGDLHKLYNQSYLEKIFGSGYRSWVRDIYTYACVCGSDLTPWTLRALGDLMPNPINNEKLTAEELQTVGQFIEDSGIGFVIDESDRGKVIVTNPLIVKKVEELPDE